LLNSFEHVTSILEDISNENWNPSRRQKIHLIKW
jgi:hypothetical protein